jgi:HupE / UreJ protein
VSELLAFATLGFRHITDPRGADHILFLLALAAIYRFRDWRECVWVVTAFTVGHSITLALAVTGALVLPSALVEFLIPVTIVATALENLIVRDRSAAIWGRRYRPVFAGVFGLVHGAGFANYLRSLFVDRIAIPLLGFNVGLEAGQLIVIALAFVSFAAVDRLILVAASAARRDDPERVVRLRTLAVSTIVMSVAASWMLDRFPW